IRGKNLDRAWLRVGHENVPGVVLFVRHQPRVRYVGATGGVDFAGAERAAEFAGAVVVQPVEFDRLLAAIAETYFSFDLSVDGLDGFDGMPSGRYYDR